MTMADITGIKARAPGITISAHLLIVQERTVVILDSDTDDGEDVRPRRCEHTGSSNDCDLSDEVNDEVEELLNDLRRRDKMAQVRSRSAKANPGKFFASSSSEDEVFIVSVSTNSEAKRFAKQSSFGRTGANQTETEKARDLARTSATSSVDREKIKDQSSSATNAMEKVKAFDFNRSSTTRTSSTEKKKAKDSEGSSVASTGSEQKEKNKDLERTSATRTSSIDKEQAKDLLLLPTQRKAQLLISLCDSPTEQVSPPSDEWSEGRYLEEVNTEFQARIGVRSPSPEPLALNFDASLEPSFFDYNSNLDFQGASDTDFPMTEARDRDNASDRSISPSPRKRKRDNSFSTNTNTNTNPTKSTIRHSLSSSSEGDKICNSSCTFPPSVPPMTTFPLTSSANYDLPNTLSEDEQERMPATNPAPKLKQKRKRTKTGVTSLYDSPSDSEEKPVKEKKRTKRTNDPGSNEAPEDIAPPVRRPKKAKKTVEPASKLRNKTNAILEMFLVLDDQKILSTQWAEDLLVKLRQKKCKYGTKRLAIAGCIEWRRFKPEVDHTKPITDVEMEIEYVLVYLLGSELAALILENAVDKFLNRIQKHYRDIKLILLVEGLDAYYRQVSSADARLYKDQVRQRLNGESSARSNCPKPRAVSRDKMEDICLWLQLERRCQIIEKETPRESVDYIIGFSEKLSQHRYKTPPAFGSFCAEAAQKRFGTKTLKDMWIDQLAQIHGVSRDIAEAIVREYPTVRSLINVYNADSDLISQKEKEEALQSVQVQSVSGTRRNVGLAISKKIYQIFTGTDGGQTL